MNGLLICPDVREVYSIDVDEDDVLGSLYDYMKCDVVEEIMLDFSNVILVDKEGKLKYPNKLGYFLLPKVPETILAGYAVILGIGEGDTEWNDTTLTAKQTKKDITWANPSEKLAKARATFVW